MELEWDEEKRQRNLRERGLDFADATRFDMESSVTRIDDRNDYGERRFVSLGPLDGRLHVLCWTQRGDRLRIISLRKANDREQKAFAAAFRRSSAAD
ncbi:BrnT family toxin [Rhizobium sp. RU36D]|uniref:BrnT family toxin n=1 Tax=Rhizobium sp. RU36D TaxID=1907415 RepID=UPI000A00C210|nr:BrnT family toxin [Rhizobium sp. RU36D]